MSQEPDHSTTDASISMGIPLAVEPTPQDAAKEKARDKQQEAIRDMKNNLDDSSV